MGLAIHSSTSGGLFNYANATVSRPCSADKRLELLREVADALGEAKALAYLGNVYRFDGRYEEATAVYQQALAISRAIGDRYDEGEILRRLGQIHHAQGHHDQAKEDFQQSLTIWRGFDDRYNEAVILDNIGALFRDMARFSEAEARLEQSLTAFRQGGDRRMQGVPLLTRAKLYAAGGDRLLTARWISGLKPLLSSSKPKIRGCSSVPREVLDDLKSKDSLFKTLNPGSSTLHRKDDDVRLGPGPVFAVRMADDHAAMAASRRALRAFFLGFVLPGDDLHLAGGPRRSLFRPERFDSVAGDVWPDTLLHDRDNRAQPGASGRTSRHGRGGLCRQGTGHTGPHASDRISLSNAEIVLGKLGVRLIPVLGLIVCLVPLSALTGLLGGIDPLALFGSFLTSVACAVLGCSLAMALSVWGRKTHEVLMVTYLLIIVWLSSPVLVMILAFTFGAARPSSVPQYLRDWVELANPYVLVYLPYTTPGKAGVLTFVAFAACCFCVSGLLALLAAYRVRAVALKQAGRASTPRRNRFARAFSRPAWLPRLPGPSLDGNPVLWREWQRFSPSRLLRVAWFLYTALGLIWVVIALRSTNNRMQGEVVSLMATFQVAVGLLLMSVSAATSLAEERVRGSLDILLSTPLSTFSILVGKWWGAFRLAPHVILWPAILGGILLWGSWELVPDTSYSSG